MADPWSAGAVQLTSSALVGWLGAGVTVGASGRDGGGMSLTLMVRWTTAAWPWTVQRTCAAYELLVS